MRLNTVLGVFAGRWQLLDIVLSTAAARSNTVLNILNVFEITLTGENH